MKGSIITEGQLDALIDALGRGSLRDALGEVLSVSVVPGGVPPIFHEWSGMRAAEGTGLWMRCVCGAVTRSHTEAVSHLQAVDEGTSGPNGPDAVLLDAYIWEYLPDRPRGGVR